MENALVGVCAGVGCTVVPPQPLANSIAMTKKPKVTRLKRSLFMFPSP
jgi:hypothetical protein